MSAARDQIPSSFNIPASFGKGRRHSHSAFTNNPLSTFD
jgi:hypothetical protein